MAHCLWDNYEGHHKYYLASWGLVAQKKEHGGLGIPNIAEMNLCLLASWVKKYNMDDDKLWKQIIDHKYQVNSPNIFPASVSGASPFWKGLLWASNAAKLGYQWKVGNGRKVKFWEDHWFGETSLAIQYWDLYILVNEQNATISEVWDGEQLKLTFRRCFCENLMMQWYELVQIANYLTISEEDDTLL